MTPPWPDIDDMPPDLVCASPPVNSVFIDNDALQRFNLVKRFDAAVQPLISAVVYAEFIGGRTMRGWRDSVEALLRDHRIRIVPLAAEDAIAFRELRIRMPPMSRLPSAPADESGIPDPAYRRKLALRRLRFDLLTFAVALRHRKRLITNNWKEFQDFPFHEAWCTWEAYSKEQGWA